MVCTTVSDQYRHYGKSEKQIATSQIPNGGFDGQGVQNTGGSMGSLYSPLCEQEPEGVGFETRL